MKRSRGRGKEEGRGEGWGLGGNKGKRNGKRRERKRGKWKRGHGRRGKGGREEGGGLTSSTTSGRHMNGKQAMAPTLSTRETPSTSSSPARVFVRVLIKSIITRPVHRPRHTPSDEQRRHPGACWGDYGARHLLLYNTWWGREGGGM